MLKRKMTSFEQIGITLLALLVVCLFYVKNFYEPVHRKYQKAHSKHAKLKRNYRKLERKYGSNENIKKAIKSTKEKVFEARKEIGQNNFSFVKRNEVIEVLSEISSLAGFYNLEIKECLPVNPWSTRKASKMPDRQNMRHCLVMTGNFLDLRDFVDGLGNMDKLLIVEKITVERLNNRGILKISMEVSI